MSAQEKLSAYDWARAFSLGHAKLMMPGFHVGQMQQAIGEALDGIETGKISRLIIEAPPQHGKSTQASVLFPAWYLGRHPEQSIIYTTYGQERAEDIGMRVRNLVRSDEHYATFHQRLSGDSAAKGHFTLEAQGRFASYFAVGRGGPITGRGADGIIIDDPLKDNTEADSPAIRKSLEDFFSSVLYTRLQKFGWIVLIMTRWHPDDLAGYLLTKYAHDGWVVLSLPAIAGVNDPLGREPGSALSPERYDLAQLLRIKSAIQPRWWEAMYQQRPAVSTGDLYKRDWFKERWTVQPQPVRYYGFSDYGVTSTGDSTEHGVFAITPDFGAYAVDWWGGQVTSDVWVEHQIRMMRRWHVSKWFDEAGPIQKAVMPYQRRAMREAQVFVPIESLPSINDKVTRSQSAIGFAAHGRIRFPEAVWADEVIEELCNFHEGATLDNKVDVVSLMGRALSKMIAAHKPHVPADDLKPFTQKWLNYEEKPHGKALY